jgi:hypothetical protein
MNIQGFWKISGKPHIATIDADIWPVETCILKYKIYRNGLRNASAPALDYFYLFRPLKESMGGQNFE